MKKENAKNWLRASVLIEGFGCLVVAAGLGIELVTHEPYGLIIITIGSLAIAVGSGLIVKARKLFK